MREGIKSKHDGKIYYHICDNPHYFRSIRIWFNPWTGAEQPQISNAICGRPTPEMEPIPPLLLQRLMRNQMASCYA